MKKQTLIFAALCLLVGLAVVPAYAQVFAERATVPFSFVVLGRTFPAGEYLLLAAPHMVKIEDSDGTPIAMAMANEISDRFAGTTGQIIFHCYRDRCFLSELLSPVKGNSRQLITSRAEAELAKKDQGEYFAVLGGNRGSSCHRKPSK